MEISAGDMDNFTTTVVAVQEVHYITLLIRGIVCKVDSYASETQSIRAKIESQYQFLNAFKSVFFNHEDASLYYAGLPDHFTNEIKRVYESLRGALAMYSLVVMKHGIQVFESPPSAATPATASKDKAAGIWPSLRFKFENNLNANLEHLRRAFDPLDWVFFDLEKILDLLKVYSASTGRLREVLMLVLLATRKSGFFENWNMATNPIGANLGLTQVATRQNRADSGADSSFSPLDGHIRGESPCRPFCDYQIVEYDARLKSGRVRVVLEEHRFNREKDVHASLLSTQRKKVELQPIRNLAWLLHGEATRDTPLVDARGLKSMYTLECRGYIDRSAENYAIVVYDLPVSASRCSKVRTLHEFINAATESGFGPSNPPYMSKPTLGNRYLLAGALAITLFNLHSSGWVHRNIWSRGVLVFPEQDQETGIIPYLVGWGPPSHQEIEQRTAPWKNHEDTDLELNIYRHPERYCKSHLPCEKRHDIYALGVVLLEIGLWKTMSTRFATLVAQVGGSGILPPAGATVSDLSELARSIELRQEMGIEYARVVQRCLATDFNVDDDDDMNTALTSSFRKLVVDRLQCGLLL